MIWRGREGKCDTSWALMRNVLGFKVAGGSDRAEPVSEGRRLDRDEKAPQRVSWHLPNGQCYTLHCTLHPRLPSPLRGFEHIASLPLVVSLVPMSPRKQRQPFTSSLVLQPSPLFGFDLLSPSITRRAHTTACPAPPDAHVVSPSLTLTTTTTFHPHLTLPPRLDALI